MSWNRNRRVFSFAALSRAPFLLRILFPLPIIMTVLKVQIDSIRFDSIPTVVILVGVLVLELFVVLAVDETKERTVPRLLTKRLCSSTTVLY
jgi:hypothetical protein